MDNYEADLSFFIDDAQFFIYLRSGFYKSQGSRWKILHCHPNYELQVFERGSFDFFLGNVSHHVDAPAIMIVSPNINHSFYSDSENASRVCVEFSVKKHGSGNAFDEYSELLSEIGDYKLFRDCELSLSEFRGNKQSCRDYETNARIKNAVGNAIIEMFGLLRNNEIRDESKTEKKHKDNKRNEILADILRYVEDHFAEDISLDEVAKIHFVSPRQIERILRNELDENFTHLVNRCRIENICREMLGGNSDYNSLSEENGFSDYSTFWRNFKRFTGMSPTLFLKKNIISEK